MKTRTRTEGLRRAPALILATACLATAAPALAQGGKKNAPYAVVAGTVFRDPGFAQPGATVVLTRKDDPTFKKQEAASDSRGDFAFRVPPGPGAYVVRAALKGFKPAQQEISVSGEEYVNATLLLVPESK